MLNAIEQPPSKKMIAVTVFVAALGYFVDVYDILLFSIVRIASLRDLGVRENELLSTGVLLLNLQMIGMLLGGIFWGILGDKRGRISVLFGSILLYSLANIANAYVLSVEMYGVLRFIAGIGLAGELGAAITLISEIMPQRSRGYGGAIVASVGACGAIAATLVAQIFTWKIAYIIGGIMGLFLLLMRLSLRESYLYRRLQCQQVQTGDLKLLFCSKERLLTYFNCILIGLPIWFFNGILITFLPEISKSLGINGTIDLGKAVIFGTVGFSIGDLCSGLLSQYLKNRSKAVAIFLSILAILILMYVFAYGQTVFYMYLLCFSLGFASGYWALLIIISAEQFGTNLRATVTTTIPNIVRASIIPMSLAFSGLGTYFSLNISALIVGFLCLSLALVGFIGLKETFGKDLNYVHRE